MLAVGGLPAFARETHAFEISARTPSVAIHAFASQAGLQILASAARLEGLTLNSLSGTYSTDAALKKMLAGSGLAYRYVAERTIALVAAPADSHQRQGSSATLAKEEPGSGEIAPPPASLSQADTGRSGFMLETILVTARRRTENLQDTPISIAAFSGDSLRRRQVFDTQDLDNITPNLQFAPVAPLSGNNSAAQVFIRGIGQTDATAGVDPGVGLYIDEVYMGSSVGGAMNLRDIAGVQVLRGPQGTLFGRNTIGGALLIATNEPGFEFGGTARIGTGTDRLAEGFLAIDAPVSESLRTRWTLGSRRQDGYVLRTFDHTDLGDVNNGSLTTKVLWQPVEALMLSFKADYAQTEEHGAPLVFAAINEAAAFPRSVSFASGCPGMVSASDPVPSVDDARCANDFWNDGPYTANGTFPLRSIVRHWGVSLITQFSALPGLSFKSITAYRQLDWAGNRDADNTPFPILHTVYTSSGDQFSQEIQALLQASNLSGVLGLFYFDQRVDDHLTVTLAPLGSPGGTQDSNDNLIANRNWAAFTQWTCKLTPRLGLTAGVRYTSETKHSTPNQFNYDSPATLYVPRRRFAKQFHATTGSMALQYRWNPAVMAYASWSQGFKSGGFNSRFNSVVAAGRPPSFEPEKADTKELGIKIDLAERLRVNAAAFSTAYDNLQFTYRVGLAPYLFNAGAASIDGVELEYQYVPVRSLILEGGFGLLDAKIDSVTTIVGATTAVSTRSKLPYTPEWQGNTSAAYSMQFGPDLKATARVEVVYTAAQFFDAGNTKQIAQNDAVTLLNAGAVFQGNERGGWSVELGVNNLADKLYPIAGNSSLTTGSGYAEVAYNRGREVFISLAKDF